MCNDAKICQCLLVIRVRFVFGKRWRGVPLRGRLEVSSGVATAMLRAFLNLVFLAVLQHDVGLLACLPAHLPVHLTARIVSLAM